MLQGKPGNPAAVGARLTLRLADRSAQSATIEAGTGCLTQSSAKVFFGYPESRLPAKLTIRWPDGRETEHTFAAPPPATLRLSQP